MRYILKFTFVYLHYVVKLFQRNTLIIIIIITTPNKTNISTAFFLLSFFLWGTKLFDSVQRNTSII